MDLGIVSSILLILTTSSATADTKCDKKFSAAPVPSTVQSQIASTSATSDADCVLKCASAGASSCCSAAFVPETKVCLTAASCFADFGSVSLGSGVVYRMKGEPPSYTSVFAQVGSRTFRVIQQRSKGILSFARSWAEYENGFGDDTDFWLGLRAINQLTGNTPRLFRMEAVTWSNLLYVSENSGFSVGDASTSYTLSSGTYLSASSNTSGDGLASHNGMKFSTMDMDHDARKGESCSQMYCDNAGWWFSSCSDCNPNGPYYSSAVDYGEATINWVFAGGSRIALKSIRLMLLV